MNKEEIDVSLLEKRLSQMGLMVEWKAFAALMVDWLGIQSESVPLYSKEKKWHQKAERIIGIIMDTGNFGNNIDLSYKMHRSFFIRKAISFIRYTKYAIRRGLIFPKHSVSYWGKMVKKGLSRVVKGDN